MKVLGIQDLYREEGYIYYMRKFSGIALIEIPGSTLNVPISFSIETSPFGTKTVVIDIDNNINYPVLPVKKALETYILKEDQEGRLP